MRKGNSRRPRINKDADNRGNRFEKRDDKKPFEKRSRPSGEDRPRGDRSPFERRDKPAGRAYDDRKNTFRDGTKREEPLTFDQKKKYNDRMAKVEKNKRKRNFGQDFLNKPDRSERGGAPKSRDKKPSYGFNKKPYTRREDKPIGEERKKFGTDRKPFQKTGFTDRDENKKKITPREDWSGGEFEKKPFRKSRYAGSEENKRPYPSRESKSFREDRNKFDRDKKPFRSRSKSTPNEDEDGNELVRLNKFISNAGICSRREADDLITAGLISVNGKIVTELGTKISRSDEVKYNNETMRKERHVYVLLNKPKDFITTADDPEKRNTVMELVASACKERIYPVGRLDRNTTGILLLTNDGELTKKLTHPSSNVAKVYHVELDKNVKLIDLEKIGEGMELEDGFIKVDEIAYANTTDGSQVGIQLHSGRNRIVRRIFESLGYEVKKLDRVSFAGLTKKDLPRGRWRFLTDLEISMLKMMTGKKSSSTV